MILFLGEAILESEQSKEFSSRAILEYKVELLLILEALPQFDEKGMREGCEYILLVHDIFFLVLLKDVLLLEDLHGIHLLILLAAYQQHLGVSASPDH